MAGSRYWTVQQSFLIVIFLIVFLQTLSLYYTNVKQTTTLVLWKQNKTPLLHWQKNKSCSSKMNYVLAKNISKIKLNVTEQNIEKLTFKQYIDEEESFLQLRPTRVTSYRHKYLSISDAVCGDSETPFLIMLCLTHPNNRIKRNTIRQTWGSVARTEKWPLVNATFSGIKLVFLLGTNENSYTTQSDINQEIAQFGDIVQTDFIDSYYNLTRKVLVGLGWVTGFCLKTSFVLKVDDDMFIHIPNLVTYLHTIEVPQQGSIIGRRNSPSPKVIRKGKWNVSVEEVPLSRYPVYVFGPAYVISGNLVARLYDAAERMPYISIEDAFITGIMRVILGVEITENRGMAKTSDKAPGPCSFLNPYRISATKVTPDLCNKIWQILNQPGGTCYMVPPSPRPRCQANCTAGEHPK